MGEAGNLGVLWGEGLERATECGGGKWAKFSGERLVDSNVVGLGKSDGDESS